MPTKILGDLIIRRRFVRRLPLCSVCSNFLNDKSFIEAGQQRIGSLLQSNKE